MLASSPCDGFLGLALPLAEYASAKGITINQPLNFKEPNTAKTLKNYEPDVIVVISYGLLLPKEILSIPKLFCINVHASLLPRWRGASPINHAIFSRDDFTGISIIKMVEELDAGPILNEKIGVQRWSAVLFGFLGILII